MQVKSVRVDVRVWNSLCERMCHVLNSVRFDVPCGGLAVRFDVPCARHCDLCGRLCDLCGRHCDLCGRLCDSCGRLCDSCVRLCNLCGSCFERACATLSVRALSERALCERALCESSCASPAVPWFTPGRDVDLTVLPGHVLSKLHSIEIAMSRQSHPIAQPPLTLSLALSLQDPHCSPRRWDRDGETSPGRLCAAGSRSVEWAEWRMMKQFQAKLLV